MIVADPARERQSAKRPPGIVDVKAFPFERGSKIVGSRRHVEEKTGYGLDCVIEAIARSLAWVAGENEVATPMIRREPIVAYRSLERRDLAPRVRRYLRSRRGPSGEWTRATVRVNRECRSYHLGWILFAWSSRQSLVESDWSGNGNGHALAVAEAGS